MCIIAEIDTDNAIDKIHEIWSSEVHGGNNTVYMIVAIGTDDMSGTATENFTIRSKAKQRNTNTVSTSPVRTSATEFLYFDTGALFEFVSQQNGDDKVTLKIETLGNFDYVDVIFAVIYILKHLSSSGFKMSLGTSLMLIF